jgi:hypothetical protein
MIRAGISIRAAIEGVAEQTENAKFKAMLTQMKKDVESGKQFSDALKRYPKTFSPLYINMVKASELSGGFSKMLERIAQYLAQQIETASMVRGAMIYPASSGRWRSAPRSSCSSSSSPASWSSSRARRPSSPCRRRRCSSSATS